MDSGSIQGVALDPLQFYTEPYKNLTRFVGCVDAAVPLGCLRGADISLLYNCLDDIQVTFVWNPVMDNEFIQTYPSDLLEAGTFPGIGVLAGANTDGGVSFAQTGLNTT